MTQYFIIFSLFIPDLGHRLWGGGGVGTDLKCLYMTVLERYHLREPDVKPVEEEEHQKLGISCAVNFSH